MDSLDTFLEAGLRVEPLSKKAWIMLGKIAVIIAKGVQVKYPNLVIILKLLLPLQELSFNDFLGFGV